MSAASDSRAERSAGEASGGVVARTTSGWHRIMRSRYARLMSATDAVESRSRSAYRSCADMSSSATRRPEAFARTVSPRGGDARR